MTMEQFRLPDPGEGLTEAEIVSWRVAVGDVVAVNDPLVEIETAKSLVELPSPHAGTVVDLLVPEGSTAQVGQPLITIALAAPGHPGPDTLSPVAPSPVAPSPVERRPVLVGYGPATPAPTRRRRRSAPEVPAAPATPATPATPVTPAGPAAVLATPPVRKLARDLGIELARVRPTGGSGVITRQDVERAAGQRPALDRPVQDRTGDDRTGEDRTGEDGSVREDRRIPVRGVRKATAAAMVASAFTAPHVTEWVQADVTRTVKLLRRLRPLPAFEGMTPLLAVARAVLWAVGRHPEVNASWDEEAGEIVLHRAVNLGIAVSTARGLIVPNIKDAGGLAPSELARALSELIATAREGRASPADQAGGTVTITNVGVFGIDGGTPILPPGESVILAVGQIRRMPWVHRGTVRPRHVVTLSLSFDHRLVDGDLGSRFLADVAGILHDPATALLG